MTVEELNKLLSKANPKANVRVVFDVGWFVGSDDYRGMVEDFEPGEIRVSKNEIVITPGKKTFYEDTDVAPKKTAKDVINKYFPGFVP